MLVEFDDEKDASNQRKHGISLQRAEAIEFASALIRYDDRDDYEEDRYQAIAFLDAYLYTLAFTMRGRVVRAISLRKATKQERNQYAEEF